MEKTPATVGIEEFPVITISQEKYVRLIAAEARMEALGTMLRVVPEYCYDDVLNAFLGKAEIEGPNRAGNTGNGGDAGCLTTS